MIIAVYFPLIAAVLVGIAMRTRVLEPKHPAVATWTVTIATALTAVLSTWSLVLLAAARLDRVAYVTERLHITGGLLRREEHIPIAVSLVALVLLLTRVARVVATVRRAHRARHAAAVFRSRNPGPLVVVADDQPIAFALAGRRHETGVVVISTAVLQSIPDEERRGVLAHENAHLDLRHHRHRTVVGLGVSLEPALRAANAASERAIERWADEHAARTRQGRSDVAAALSSFRRLAHGTVQRPVRTDTELIGGLAFARSSTQERIEALLATPPVRRARDVIPFAAMALLTAAAACDASHQLVHLLRVASR